MPERPVLSIEGNGTWEEAEDKLGAAFEQLAIAAKKAGVAAAGAPLVQYVESDENGFSFVVMLPVEKAPAKGKLPKGVKAGVSPSGPALRFSPSPESDDLDEVYARIDAYLAANNLTLDMVVEEYGEDAIASLEDRVVVDVYVFAE
jgi:effector-binding domain-containing protein